MELWRIIALQHALRTRGRGPPPVMSSTIGGGSHGRQLISSTPEEKLPTLFAGEDQGRVANQNDEVLDSEVMSCFGGW